MRENEKQRTQMSDINYLIFKLSCEINTVILILRILKSEI